MKLVISISSRRFRRRVTLEHAYKGSLVSGELVSAIHRVVVSHLVFQKCLYRKFVPWQSKLPSNGQLKPVVFKLGMNHKHVYIQSS